MGIYGRAFYLDAYNRLHLMFNTYYAPVMKHTHLYQLNSSDYIVIVAEQSILNSFMELIYAWCCLFRMKFCFVFQF